MTEKPNDAVIVDIGGTKVAVGLVDQCGKILSQLRKPMVANGKPEAALEAVTAAIDSVSGYTRQSPHA
jgi:predicted NBD/HSP70 family sugar kinase